MEQLGLALIRLLISYIPSEVCILPRLREWDKFVEAGTNRIAPSRHLLVDTVRHELGTWSSTPGIQTTVSFTIQRNY